MKASEDARLVAAYSNLPWQEVLKALHLYESQSEPKAKAKKRILRLLHPDGSYCRHKNTEDKAIAEAQFVFLNSIL